MTFDFLPRDLPVRILQEVLVEADHLPPDMLTRTVQPPTPSCADLQGWITALDDNSRRSDLWLMEFHEVWRGPISFVSVCTAAPGIAARLPAQPGPESPRRMTCARALAWHGDHAATPVLFAEADRLWPGGDLPHRGPVPFTQDSPDHRATPDLCYVLHTLALLRDCRALPLMTRVSAHLNATPERLGDRACLPLLRGLQREPLLIRTPIESRTTCGPGPTNGRRRTYGFRGMDVQAARPVQNGTSRAWPLSQLYGN